MLILLEAATTLVCIVLFVWMVVRSFLLRRRLRRLTGDLEKINQNICPGCGYDMRASPTRCPECGREVKETEQELIDFAKKHSNSN